jgi:hypothetical protein
MLTCQAVLNQHHQQKQNFSCNCLKTIISGGKVINVSTDSRLAKWWPLKSKCYLLQGTSAATLSQSDCISLISSSTVQYNVSYQIHSKIIVITSLRKRRRIWILKLWSLNGQQFWVSSEWDTGSERMMQATIVHYDYRHPGALED